MTTLKALHVIHLNPGGEREFKGKTDEYGESIYQPVTREVAPGEIFEPENAAEAQWLLDNDCAIAATQDEIVLAGRRTGDAAGNAGALADRQVRRITQSETHSDGGGAR